MKLARSLFVIVALMVAGLAGGTTFVPTTDRELVDRSDAVVIGSVRHVAGRETAEGTPLTDVTLVVEQTLKGTPAAGQTVTVTDFGGPSRGKFVFVMGSAVYHAGERVLVFLRHAPDGHWFTSAMSLGKFTFSRNTDGAAIVVRDTQGELEGDAPRLAADFSRFVRDAGRGLRAPAPNYFSPAPDAHLLAPEANSAASYALSVNGPSGTKPVRQASGGITLTMTGSLAGINTNTLNAGAASWTNDPNSFVVVSASGASNPGAAPNTIDGVNGIYLGYSGPVDPNAQCDAALACTALSGDGNTHTFDGSTFYNLTDVDIVFRPGAWTQAQFDVIATHELGHSLGLRHSDAGSPFSNTAIMASNTSTTFGTNLQQWDRDAIDTLYGSGPPCTAPAINGTSGGGSVASGQSATLTVSASGGVAPLSYQWYDGTSGNTSTPVGTNNASFTTPPITSTKNYWVRVSSNCGMSADSGTITVTVAACTAPSVAGTSGGGNVTSGQSTTLTVSATGSNPLNYQWYDGASGNTSTPVGTNNASFNTPPITTTKNYWVKVVNSCGFAASNTIIVTPVACALPNILSDPASQTVNAGATVQLSVNAGGAGPFAYQWYQGAKGTVTTPVGSNSPTFTTPAINQTTSYWVRVSNGCGSTDSNAAILSLAGSCTPPAVSIQPQTNLVVPTPRPIVLVAGGSGDGPLSYQWYKGTPPDTSTKVNGQAPSDSRWVQMVFVELLGRTASASDLSTFTALIGQQGGSRLVAAKAILTSNESRLVTVRSLYSQLLGRTPSAAEETFWLGAMQNGLTEEGLDAGILGSAEFFALNGGTNATWKARTAQFLYGTPSAGQLGAIDALIAGGGSRTSMAKALVAATDVRSLHIQGWFTSFLRRAATPAEVSSMLTLLGSSGGDYNAVLAAIFSSNEYGSFPTALITDPITGPVNYWVQVSNGCGSANSNAAAIVASAGCAPPVILAQPASLSAGLGTFVFGVSAVGTTPLTYQWYDGQAVDTSKPIAGATDSSLTVTKGAPGTYHYWVRVSNECGGSSSNTATATVSCIVPQPVLTAPGEIKPGETFRISWTAVPGATSYVVTPVNAAIVSCSAPLTEACLQPTIPGPGNITVTVKAVASCATGPDSVPASIYVNPPPPSNSTRFDYASLTRVPITQTIFIGGNPVTAKTALDTNDAFVITSDRPWLTVSPSTGPLPPEGVNVVATVDPAQLPSGTSGATLTIVKFTQGQGKTISSTSTTSTGVSFSLVSPVSPTPKNNNSPADTLLIPAVAHADGIGSHFQSDIRIANLGDKTATYLLSFTPSSTDGTQKGLQSTISIDPGDTKALDNIVKNWFGAGVAGIPGVGTLEIRPASTSTGSSGTGTTSPRVGSTTVASSRTYNVGDAGTFGQFIPAIPLLNFLMKSDTARLSLQQVAQSSAYRTNVGLVEGSGQKADLTLRLLTSGGQTLGEVPFSLRPFEHTQFNLGAVFPGVNLTDGRLEVKVTSDGGSVSAYASVLDNKTTDPLLVFPVQPGLVSAQRYVVPGVAELNNGAANFHTDLRIFNGSTSPVNVTVAYSTNDRTPPAPVQMTINAGEVKIIDNTLQTLWGISGSGGAVVVTTDGNSSLVLTARTFSRRDDGGTFGQFIPGLSEKEGAGNGERPLQVLQLEQSPGFRSNLGLAELSGKPVSVKLRATVPDSRVSASVDVNLGPNEFRQLSSIFSSMGYGTIYNGRISVEVTGGEGRVGAYGSVIDNRTQDPTYVPAQ